MALPFAPVRNHSITPMFVGGMDMGTLSTTALSSAYVFGTSGAAQAWQFMLEASGTLTDFYFIPSAKNGTGSGDGNINWYIRENFTVGTNYKPGSTVTASGTIAVSGLSANTWATVSGLSVSLTAGVWYHLIIADADGDGTNYMTINRACSTGDWTPGAFCPNNVVTSDGWATAGTVSGNPPVCAIKVGGVVYGGSLGYTPNNFTSNTTARGMKITIPAGYPRTRLVALSWVQAALAGGWTFKVFRGDGTLPNTTPYYSWSIPANVDYSNTQFNSGGRQILPLPTPPLILPGNTWYFVLVPDVSSTNPQKYTIGTSPPADIVALLSGVSGVTYKAVQETAGPAWSETDELIYIRFAMVPEVAPTVAA